MNHYAPNHMLAPKENIYYLSILSQIGKSEEGHNQLCMEFIQTLLRSTTP